MDDTNAASIGVSRIRDVDDLPVRKAKIPAKEAMQTSTNIPT
jgi:hypothetical protein